jgi:O-methyltransferase
MIRGVRAYSMTSVERLYNLMEAVRFVIRNDIEGGFVECGVWKGGSMMLVARSLIELGVTDRELFLFDTFSGMPAPAPNDRTNTGLDGREIFSKHATQEGGSDWCAASLGEVQANMRSVGYPGDRVLCVQGKVEDTLPRCAPAKIALLRLDTDFYSSTKHAMMHLFPRLSSGGVLIVDDYGTWQGCRLALDEYVQEKDPRLFLIRVDNSCRIAVKP